MGICIQKRVYDSRYSFPKKYTNFIYLGFADYYVVILLIQSTIKINTQD
jgi:hypothetical protein